MKDKIWLSSPHMGDNEQNFVQEAFETNWIAPLGPHVDGFEQDICRYTGAGHAAALSSGTAALHLALILLDIKPGDLVICQSMTFSATANPIAYQGAIPVFVDSEKDTWNMDPVCLEQAVNACVNGDLVYHGKKLPPKKPSAIIPVHLYGMPAKMGEIIKIAANHDIPVIEDAAESLGSRIDGHHTGTGSKMGILSFNGNKIITTSGGGALISDDEKLIARARFLSTQARDPAPHYQHSRIGYNYRLSNVLAGIGRGQMQVLDSRVAQRQANHNRYREYFDALKNKGYHVRFQEGMPGMDSNRWLSAILIDPDENREVTREKVRLVLEKENIESRPLWKPMHLQPVFEKEPFFGEGISENLFEHGLCLPSGSNLTEKDFGRIFETLNRIFI